MSARRIDQIILARGIRGILIPPEPDPLFRTTLDLSKIAAVATTTTAEPVNLHRVLPNNFFNVRLMLEEAAAPPPAAPVTLRCIFSRAIPPTTPTTCARSSSATKTASAAYEVWNEPWQIKWFGTHYVEHEGRQEIMPSEDPQKDYVALMRAAYKAVKSVDPTITVVGFNTTSNTEPKHIPEGVFTGAEWTAGVLAAGGENYADVASFHHYTADLSGFPDDNVTRAVRNALGPNALVPVRSSLPIWMSEGSSTVSGLARYGLYRHALPYRNGEDLLRLTESVLRYDVAMLANGVEKIFLYSMGDIDSQGSPGSFRTLVNSDGSLHPSALGRASLAWHIDGLRFVQALGLKDGVYSYIFTDDTRSVAVICPRGGHGSLPLPPAKDNIVLRDLYCNPLPADAAVDNQTVFLSFKGTVDRLLSLLEQAIGQMLCPLIRGTNYDQQKRWQECEHYGSAFSMPARTKNLSMPRSPSSAVCKRMACLPQVPNISLARGSTSAISIYSQRSIH